MGEIAEIIENKNINKILIIRINKENNNTKTKYIYQS